MFGKFIEGDYQAYWGARAIYGGHRSNYYVDIVADRQTHENTNKAFLDWVVDVAMPWLREEIKRRGLSTDSAETLIFEEKKFRLEASPNGSYGYLYIGAVERP